MISLWLCNPNEDFIIEKYGKNMEIMTADNHSFSLKSLQGQSLSIIGKDESTIFAVFCGHRLAFKKEFALIIHGTLTGKTKTPPKILNQPTNCRHCCGDCKKCCS